MAKPTTTSSTSAGVRPTPRASATRAARAWAAATSGVVTSRARSPNGTTTDGPAFIGSPVRVRGTGSRPPGAANGATVTPARSSASRTHRAWRSAPGRSPWRQRVSTSRATHDPSTASSPPATASELARSAASDGSSTSASGWWRAPADRRRRSRGRTNPSLTTRTPATAAGPATALAGGATSTVQRGARAAHHHPGECRVHRHGVVQRPVRLHVGDGAAHRLGLAGQGRPLLDHVGGEPPGATSTGRRPNPGAVADRRRGPR